ncbi:FAD-dependent monooxygenase [Streptomyces sp. BH097]|uniref:FAD-dependent monooxygenase n=1 Tax=unclassified Streptomyces TaxID=2593676 RepID=UPI003BB7B970
MTAQPHDRNAAKRERLGTAVVVGGSLSGLMTGLALSRAGIDVTVLERVGSFPRSGASIGGVSESLLERITGRPRSRKDSTAQRRLPSDVQTWTAVHARLRAAAGDDPHIRLRHGATVQSVGQDAESAWVTTSDGRTFGGDVVIGADGHRSVVRRTVAPEHQDAQFAGYVIWLGLADESVIASRHRWPRDVDILSSGDDYLLGYPLAARDGSVAPGSRQIGWAWYDASRNDLLREKGCVTGNVVQHSLAAADIPESTFTELAAEATDLWPPLWRDVILDCIERRAVIGTPIAEYVPERLVQGRLALVGDAAHVPTPMTGSGFNASLYDAEAVAEAVAAGLQGSSVARALQGYERERLDSARSMVRSGQQFSRSFAGQTV